ncbi:hypothetical protein KKA17_05625 [bacterium]|nr:hypothetical protein [bacterium]MBU1883975.1 hypothetical protein [bacterium]
MQENKAIKTERYLNIDEINTHLEKVEYIIMAAPAPEHFKDTPVHLTIFLNTSEHFPDEIKEMIFDKFISDYEITKYAEVMSQLMPVGFAVTVHDTPMPMLLVKPQDQSSIPHVPMHVIDFLADSREFEEVTTKSLTGWSYVYES